jgi:hypothetical protein
MKVAAKIVILGAQGSGKSWLAARLAEALAENCTSHSIVERASLPADIASFDVVVLMGLDLAFSDPAIPVAQRNALETQDQALRDSLARLGTKFHVIYGRGDARLQQALSVIASPVTMNSVAGYAISTRPSGQSSLKDSENWHWSCEKCSDPDCEHQLFTQLIS